MMKEISYAHATRSTSTSFRKQRSMSSSATCSPVISRPKSSFSATKPRQEPCISPPGLEMPFFNSMSSSVASSLEDIFGNLELETTKTEIKPEVIPTPEANIFKVHPRIKSLQTKSYDRKRSNSFSLAYSNIKSNFEVEEVRSYPSTANEVLEQCINGQQTMSQLKITYNSCDDKNVLKDLAKGIQELISLENLKIIEIEKALDIVEQKLKFEKNGCNHLPIFKKLSTQLRESKKCIFQLQLHHHAIVNRRLYIKLTEQADKELENDIFAAIEQQRQEFETEFSDGDMSDSSSTISAPSKSTSPMLNPELNPAAKEFEPIQWGEPRTEKPPGYSHLHETFRQRTGSCPIVSSRTSHVNKKTNTQKQITKKSLLGERPKIDTQPKIVFPAKIGLVPNSISAYPVVAPVMLHSNVFFIQPFILQNQALLKRSLCPR